MLHLKNSIWALILPLCMNTWYIMVLRTFYKTSVPESLIESAKLDGASELRLFFKIVFPISLPGIATIALFFSLTYWNDWFNALMYIDDQQIVPLQYFLVRMQSSSEFLSQNVMKLGPRFAEAMKLLPKESSRMAAVVLATAPIIFAYPFFQRFFINGLTIGGVKE
jgi:putative aldouronate transport system permease protein